MERRWDRVMMSVAGVRMEGGINGVIGLLVTVII